MVLHRSQSRDTSRGQILGVQKHWNATFFSKDSRIGCLLHGKTRKLSQSLRLSEPPLKAVRINQTEKAERLASGKLSKVCQRRNVGRKWNKDVSMYALRKY